MPRSAVSGRETIIQEFVELVEAENEQAVRDGVYEYVELNGSSVTIPRAAS